MNIKEIIDYTRSEVLDDIILPYKWSNQYLIVQLNRAYDRLARETLSIIDSETSTYCRVPLLSNLTLHSLHSKVLFVHEGIYLESNGYLLDKKTESYMSRYVNWRSTTTAGPPLFIIMDSSHRKFSLYPKYNTNGYWAGSSDISFDAGTKTITKAGADFDDYLESGDSFVVTNTTNNNTTFTVVSVSATDIVVSETVVDESNTSAIIRQERDALKLRVARLPASIYTANDLELSTPPTPEIDAQYHYGLSDGIGEYAFLKPDSEAFDQSASDRCKNNFQRFIDEVKLATAILTGGNLQQGSPHYGSL